MSATSRVCDCPHGFVEWTACGVCCQRVALFEHDRATRAVALVAELRHRIRIAKRALRKSTKYEPWDDFEWTASVALDLRRTDYVRSKPKVRR